MPLITCRTHASFHAFWMGIVFTLLLLTIPRSGLAFNYLDFEKLVKGGMSRDLLEVKLESEAVEFEFDQIMYLKERGIDQDLVEYLLRYYLVRLPTIEVELLVRLKKDGYSDDIITLLVNRAGYNGPVTVEQSLQLQEAGISPDLLRRLIRL